MSAAITPSHRDDTLAPASIGPRYEVIRELGRGGMAIVYLVRDRSDGVERAVKVVHSKFTGDSEATARFEREARLLAELEHPRIVRVHSVEWIDGAGLALVMDRVPGHTLKQIIRDQGALPPDETARIMGDIAEALEYAHSHGIVHRDVKPENIFVDAESGHALLSDFGIARSMEGETQLTMAGVAIGTPTYMSPEQIDGDRLDGRSDLYSLGLVGWEMLTGERPWAGETLYNIIYKQKHDQLRAIDTYRADVPVRLIAIIEGLLEKSPAARWQSAAALREMLTSEEPVSRHVAHGASRRNAQSITDRHDVLRAAGGRAAAHVEAHVGNRRGGGLCSIGEWDDSVRSYRATVQLASGQSGRGAARSSAPRCAGADRG